MGLAASQARFLAITSRKMNCEFESMQIAQEKLSVTREQQVAAQDYQDSLNATKLVWDADNSCDGTGEVYNLSYGVLMTPSALNEYDPYLITDAKGRIVLDNDTFSAALAAGVIDKTGAPSGSFSIGKTDGTTRGSRNAFLYQLGVQNKADSSLIESIINLGADGYSSKAGLGGGILDKTLSGAMTTNKFVDYMQTAKYETDTTEKFPTLFGGTHTFKTGEYIYNLNLAATFATATGAEVDGQKTFTDQDIEKVFCTTTSPKNIDKDGTDGNKNKLIITKNGTALSVSEIKKLTLGDLLSGKYEMTGLMDKAGMSDNAGKILKTIAELLGMGSQDVRGLNTDDTASMALEHAYEFTRLQLNADFAQSAKSGTTGKSISNAIKKSQETNCITTVGDDISSISLTNMLKSFLTNFAIAIDGYDAGYNIDKSSTKKSNYITDDPTYYFVLKNDSAITQQDALNADFYNMLYNQLCMYGACTDETIREKVTDQSYLSHALKNGQLFISMLNNDGYFYQGHYTSTAHIAEVTDDDAIAQAEAEYNVKKSKLSYKEQNLELKMKNIDTELSALTTEYDTVKNLISKNVEKVFTMFST